MGERGKKNERKTHGDGSRSSSHSSEDGERNKCMYISIFHYAQLNISTEGLEHEDFDRFLALVFYVYLSIPLRFLSLSLSYSLSLFLSDLLFSLHTSRRPIYFGLDKFFFLFSCCTHTHTLAPSSVFIRCALRSHPMPIQFMCTVHTRPTE